MTYFQIGLCHRVFFILLLDFSWFFVCICTYMALKFSIKAWMVWIFGNFIFKHSLDHSNTSMVLRTSLLKQKHYWVSANGWVKMTSLLKMSFFTQVVLSIAVIFQLSYNPRTPEEHGTYSDHTAVQPLRMGESRGEGPQLRTTTLGKRDFLMVQIMF